MIFKGFADQLLTAARISPTALYTGHVWQAHERSVPELESWPARCLHTGLAPAMAMSRKLGGPTLEDFLLARHDLIDLHLTKAIESGAATQVLEIAAGLSPRGCRFVQKYGDDITYIEADLPGLVAQKRKRLQQRLGVCPNHRVEIIDAFAHEGPHSLQALAGSLDPDRGLVVITEGLLNYFDKQAVLGLWQRLGQVLAGFSHGMYLSDLHLSAHNNDPVARAFAAALGVFVRGRVHLHFEQPGEVVTAMQARGLACEVQNPHAFADELPSCAATGASLVRILHASAMHY